MAAIGYAKKCMDLELVMDGEFLFFLTNVHTKWWIYPLGFWNLFRFH